MHTDAQIQPATCTWTHRQTDKLQKRPTDYLHMQIRLICVLIVEILSAFDKVPFCQTDVKIRRLVELLIPEFDCAPSLFRPCSSVSLLERKAQVG